MNAPPSWPPIPRRSAPLETPEERRKLMSLSAPALGAVIHRESPKNPGLFRKSRKNPITPVLARKDLCSKSRKSQKSLKSRSKDKLTAETAVSEAGSGDAQNSPNTRTSRYLSGNHPNFQIIFEISVFPIRDHANSWAFPEFPKFPVFPIFKNRWPREGDNP